MKRVVLILACMLAATAVWAAPGDTPLGPVGSAVLAVRERNEVAAPTGASTIYIRTTASHHTTVEFSIIAWRSEGGAWSVSQMGVEGPGLLAIEPHVIPERTRVLPAADGLELDTLLQNPMLYGEPTRSFDSPPGIGGPTFAMEIVTPSRRFVVGWTNRLSGLSGRVADIVLGRD